jgi:hypothetical protein
MEYKCLECKKEYASYKSLWNHNKIKHKTNVAKTDTPVAKISSCVDNINTNDDNSSCFYCNKKLCDRKSRWRHEKKCKKNNEIIEIKNQNIKMEQEIKKLKKDVINLSKKTTPTTLVNNINNGININVNSLGYENIQSKLLEKEKINLLTSVLFKEYPLIELVRKIYTDDKFKEDRNTLLTNLQNKSCLVYKSDVNKFEATNKNEHIDNIITARKDDLISMYAEFSESTKIKDYTKKLIEDYLEKVEGINKKDKKLKALYEKHKEEIIYIIYNCKEFMGSIRNHLIGENDIDL